MFIFGRACGCFLYAPSIFRTDRDVREIEQQRVCPANSTLNSVHGSTLFNRLFSKAYGDSIFKSVGGKDEKGFYIFILSVLCGGVEC